MHNSTTYLLGALIGLLCGLALAYLITRVRRNNAQAIQRHLVNQVNALRAALNRARTLDIRLIADVRTLRAHIADLTRAAETADHPPVFTELDHALLLDIAKHLALAASTGRVLGASMEANSLDALSGHAKTMAETLKASLDAAQKRTASAPARYVTQELAHA